MCARVLVRVRVSARVCVGAHVSTRIESGLLFFLFDNSRTTAVMALHSTPKRCVKVQMSHVACVWWGQVCVLVEYHTVSYTHSTEKQGRHGDPPHAKERQWVNEPV